MNYLLTLILSLSLFNVLGQERTRKFNTHNDYKNDIEELNKLIKFYPDSSSLYVKRAVNIYIITFNSKSGESQGYNRKQVIEDFDKAIEVDPEIVENYYQRAEYKWKIYSDTTGALSDYNKAFELENRKHIALYKRSGFFKQIGDFNKACADIVKCAEIGYGPGVESYIDFCKSKGF